MNDLQKDSTLEVSAEAMAHQPSLRGPQPRTNLIGGLLAGLVAATVGAVAWAAITAATGYQIGFMAIGVGLLVGFAVRIVGRGHTPVFGAVGAALALVGCAAGNLLAGCIMIAKQQDVGTFEVVRHLDAELVGTIMGALFSPMDLLFYGLAVYEGWKLSFTPEEGFAQPAEMAVEESGGSSPAAGQEATE